MATPGAQRGFTLVEALAALGIVSLIVISFIGIRTSALVDAMQARNWRLAREIAEEQMSTLRAGMRDVSQQSGEVVSLDEQYEDFSYKVVIGETAVADLESQAASDAAGGSEAAVERNEWQQNRENFRTAQARGLSAADYSAQRATEEQDAVLRLSTEAPSPTKFEVVAVAVYFPKLDPDFEGQQESLVIKARLSTLALSGRTPEEAERLAQANGEAGAAGGNPGGAAPGGGGGGGAGAMSEAGGR